MFISHDVRHKGLIKYFPSFLGKYFFLHREEHLILEATLNITLLHFQFISNCSKNPMIKFSYML